jgi:hypothetical protein
MENPIIRLPLFLLLCVHSWHTGGQTVSGVINSYYKVTYLVPTYNSVRIQTVAGLAPGDRVMLIQMKGAVIASDNNSGFGSITSIGTAGNWEFATVCGFLNDTVVFSDALQNIYDVNGFVQLVRVPVFTDVTVTGTLQAGEWDPVAGTGGVLVLEATGTITLQANISADSAGFKGGSLFYNTTNRCGPRSNWYYSAASASEPNLGGSPKGEGIAAFIASREYGRGKQSNGGGGANVDNTGGGGGGNYGAGGQGGNKTNAGLCNASTPGQGGVALSSFGYSSSSNRMFMGGGGGCGEMNNIYNAPYPAGTPGGDGGGIVILKCNTLVANNYRISANGAQGVNPGLPVSTEAAGDGGGGGGAGGAVLLAVTTISGNLNVQARGAEGSKAGFQTQCPGPGGGGGGGVIWSANPLPGTVTTNVAGGAAGTIKDAPAHNPPCENTANGAAAGDDGAVLTGFSIPASSAFNCGAILATGIWAQWLGRRTGNDVTLNWKLHPQSFITKLVVERSVPGGPFEPVFQQQQLFDAAQQWTDRSPVFPAAYRLVATTGDLKTFITHPLVFRTSRQQSIAIYPNPVAQLLHLRLPVPVSGVLKMEIQSLSGQRFLTLNQQAVRQQEFTAPVEHLPPGVYLLHCYWQQEWFVAKFIKQ